MFEVEKKQLKSSPEKGFAFYHEGRRKVHRDGHIEVDRTSHSVPFMGPSGVARAILSRQRLLGKVRRW